MNAQTVKKLDADLISTTRKAVSAGISLNLSIPTRTTFLQVEEKTIPEC